MELAGQIGLVPPSSIAAHAVARFIGSPYSHVVIAINNQLCVSAAPPFVQLAETPGNAAWSRFPLTDHERDAIVSYAKACIGLPYAYLTDAGIAAQRLHLPLPQSLVSWLDDQARVQCAQLAIRAYRYGLGIDLTDQALPHPGHLATYWQDQGWI